MMFQEVFTHEYFYLSFLPISFLGVGFWFLFFERNRKEKDPLLIFLLALISGGFSAYLFSVVGKNLGLENFLVLIFGEELFKIFFAILFMEIFSQRFKTVAGGIVFGFSVGLGFSFVENLVYLFQAYQQSSFESYFWIVFQGRFWSSTILHGVTTSLFGLFYSAAYLAKTVYKKDHKSPLLTFFKPPLSFTTWFQILTFHVARKHLLWENKPTLKGHFARAVILEGFLFSFLIHVLFNLAVEKGSPVFSFFMALVFMFFLRKKLDRIE